MPDSTQTPIDLRPRADALGLSEMASTSDHSALARTRRTGAGRIAAVTSGPLTVAPVGTDSEVGLPARPLRMPRLRPSGQAWPYRFVTARELATRRSWLTVTLGSLVLLLAGANLTLILRPWEAEPIAAGAPLHLLASVSIAPSAASQAAPATATSLGSDPEQAMSRSRSAQDDATAPGAAPTSDPAAPAGSQRPGEFGLPRLPTAPAPLPELRIVPASASPARVELAVAGMAPGVTAPAVPVFVAGLTQAMSAPAAAAEPSASESSSAASFSAGATPPAQVPAAAATPQAATIAIAGTSEAATIAIAGTSEAATIAIAGTSEAGAPAGPQAGARAGPAMSSAAPLVGPAADGGPYRSAAPQAGAHAPTHAKGKARGAAKPSAGAAPDVTRSSASSVQAPGRASKTTARPSTLGG